MKKILSLLVVLALCVTSFGFVASAAGTDLVWSLAAYRNSGLTSSMNASASAVYLAVKLDVNPGMAGQKFDVIFDPSVVTYDSFSVIGDPPVVGYETDDDGNPIYTSPIYGPAPEFVGKPYDKGTYLKPGDTYVDGTVTNFFRWVGGSATNLSTTGVFVRIKFNIISGVQASTKFKLVVDPLQTGRTDPQVYYTSNSPEITVPLHGYYNLNFNKNTTDSVTNLQATTGVLNNGVYTLANAAVPVRAGYTFLGWSTDTTAANITSSVTVSGAEKTVYAIWQAAVTNFTLNFDKNTSDEVTGLPTAQTLTKDTAFDLSTLTAPARAGYDFLGWSTDTTAANIVTSITLTSADKTLYAIWQLKPPTTYQLSFDKNTTDSVTGMPSAQTLTKDVAFDLSTLSTPARVGYNFAGWSTDTTAANIVSSITLTSADKTLYAIWSVIPPTTYQLSFDKNTTDAVTGLPEAKTLTKDVAFDLSTLAAPSRTGYTFDGWSTDTTAANKITSITLTTEGKTLYAIWKLKTHEEIKQGPTSTRPGVKEIKDDFGNVISTEPIAMLPHFGTQRGLQVPSTATTDDATTTVRLILGINSLEYQKAGFVVASQTNLDKDGYTPGDEYSVLINSNTVYETITAGGHTYTAADFGAKYLVVIEIKNFPKAAYQHGVRFQGFTITEDGDYHFDNKVVTTVNTLITNK